MVDLVKRGAKIKDAFAKKKASPKFKGITVKSAGAYFETYSSLTFGIHFSDGTTHWLTPSEQVKIRDCSDSYASNQLEVACLLRAMADKIERSYHEFSNQYDKGDK